MKKENLFIGTSGWVYPHWDGIFYPEDLSSKDKLRYFSKYFKTTEINYSFYHLPRKSTYQNWYNQTTSDFLFSVKVSRFITHIKRLKGVRKAWKQFARSALNLKEKLGPILFQFPPSFKATPENVKRLNEFLKLITFSKLGNKFTMVKRLPLRYAFEFRHKTWFTPLDNKNLMGCDEKIYNLLKKYKIAWVIADSPYYPKAEEITADFVYVRMHGSKILFSSKYTKKELQDLAKKIKKWLKQKLDIYIYFNNDVQGFAIKNAKTLLRLSEK